MGGLLQCLHQRDAVRHPGHVQDRLAYSAIITKASLNYDGVPWLLYDAHFHRAAAAAKCTNWAQVDASIWTMYFTSANLSHRGVAGLAVVPAPTEEDTQRKKATTSRGAKSTQWVRYSPYDPPFPICKNWNYKSCTDESCRFRHICTECHSPNHPWKDCYKVSASTKDDQHANSGKPIPNNGPRKGRQ